MVESDSRHNLNNLCKLKNSVQEYFLLNERYRCSLFMDFYFIFSQDITFFTFLNCSFKRKRAEMFP